MYIKQFLARYSAPLKKNAMLVILVLVYLFFMVTTGGAIFKPMNFNALITQNAYVYILAVGMLMCMLTGGNIDLSCGSFVCLVGAFGGVLMVISKMNTGVSIVLMLLLGILYGCGLGYLIAYVHIPPWIATLAGYLAFRGLGTSILSSNSKTGSIAPFPESFLKLFSGKIFQTKMSVFNWPCMIAGIVAAVITVAVIFMTRQSRLQKGYEADSFGAACGKSLISAAAILLVMYKLANAGGIPTVLIWVVAVVLIYSFITSKTTIGRHFYVVGGNIEAARLSGVNTRRIMFLAYLNMAILTVIASWTVMARFQAANSTAGTNFEMDAISACVVGGVSASGGAGSVIGMVIGATLIGVINLGMSLMGIDANYQKVVKGVVLLGAVVFDILSKKRKG
ncbi:MAG: sugar ABC transporter permease [Clostridia bacterium]|nr:sugar ABC transporter permease [Clostridia bacterium]